MLFSKNTLGWKIEKTAKGMPTPEFSSKELRRQLETHYPEVHHVNTDTLYSVIRRTMSELVRVGIVKRLETYGKGSGGPVMYRRTDVPQQMDAAQFILKHHPHEVNRRAAVEQQMWNVVNGKAPLPDIETIRSWATKLGVPDCDCFNTTRR